MIEYEKLSSSAKDSVGKVFLFGGCAGVCVAMLSAVFGFGAALIFLSIVQAFGVAFVTFAVVAALAACVVNHAANCALMDAYRKEKAEAKNGGE